MMHFVAVPQSTIFVDCVALLVLLQKNSAVIYLDGSPVRFILHPSFEYYRVA